MKKTIKGFIYAEPDTFSTKEHAVLFGFSMYAPTQDLWPERVIVCEHAIEVDVPDTFDLRPGMIAALEKQKQILHAAYAAKVKEINGQLAKLQALEYVEA